MNDFEFLQVAVEQMQKSVDAGGFPAGAIIVKNGEIISRGISIGALIHDPTSHSETASIRDACVNLKTSDLTGATLYASLQPCLMCFSVANWAHVSRIVYGLSKSDDSVAKGYYEGATDIAGVNKNNSYQIELTHLTGLEDQIKSIIKKWELSFSVS